MTRFGKPIHHLKIKGDFDSEIDFKSFPLVVHPFIEFAACNKANYQYYDNWDRLSTRQKATIVAQYHLDKLIDQHNKAAEKAHYEMESKKGK